MGYVCAKCGKKVKGDDENFRCLYCGGRIIIKERPNITTEISTD